MILITANHPWLTADRGWVEAGGLRAGEALVTLNGSSGTVAWVHTVPGQADMYNLTVANDHTYAVGSGQWVVHNEGPCPGDSLPKYGEGDYKTRGDFVRPDGTTQRLVSGYSEDDISLQPRQLLPDVWPGMARGYANWDHVEAHAATLMRFEGLQGGELWINNPSGPCLGVVGCNANLPYMLPEGATLRVYWPGGEGGSWVGQAYTGLPDEQWIPWKPSR